MGCVQTKATGTQEEFRQLNRPTSAPLGAPSSLNRLSNHIPTTGPLSSQDYWSRLDYGATESVELDGLRVRYAFVTQRGFYPEAPNKANQDAVCVKKDFADRQKQMFFGVFDGHGVHGTDAAQFAKAKVPVNLAGEAGLEDAPEEAFRQAMLQTNQQLHTSAVDDSMSGTTAITCLLRGRQAWIANVGDSRAVLAERQGDGLVAHPLSRDQTPFRRDECDRVKRAGARVLTLDQIEGLKDPNVECWKNEEEDSGDPPRLWAHNAMFPGTAFTRSIGDALAEEIGVCAEPEVELRTISSANPFLVIASDGVFEFLSNKAVVDLVAQFEDPQEAAIALVVESYHLWLSYETRTDDISAVVIMLEGMDRAPQAPPPQMQCAPSASCLPGRQPPQVSRGERQEYRLAARVTPPPAEQAVATLDVAAGLGLPLSRVAQACGEGGIAVAVTHPLAEGWAPPSGSLCSTPGTATGWSASRRMRKMRSGMPNGLAKSLSTSKSFVGNFAKSFTQPGYSHLDDGLDDPLVRPNSLTSMSSSRVFSEDECLAKPKRVMERQESRSRHTLPVSGSPKMSMPPSVLQMSDSFTSNEGVPSR